MRATLRALLAVLQAFPARRRWAGLAWVVGVIVVVTQLGHIVWIADTLRFFALVVCVTVFFGWLVIMGRSARVYYETTHDDESPADADMREHIWEITLSYLILVGIVGYVVALTIGEPISGRAIPGLLIAGPLGVHALWLFIRPDRAQRIAPDERTTTVKGPETVPGGRRRYDPPAR